MVGASGFLLLADVQLPDAGVLAAGSLLGGRLGGGLVRRLPDRVLRGLVLGVGVAVAIALLL